MLPFSTITTSTTRLLVLCVAITAAHGKIYLRDTFPTPDLGLWTPSSASGTFNVSYGNFYADPIHNLGMQTTSDLTKYAYSRVFDDVFDAMEASRDLVVQFSVKHEQNIDCGGGYVKIMPPGLEPADFNDQTPYHIMFGPDICGMTKKTHLIVTDVSGAQREMNASVYPATDQLTHVYTLVMRQDKTYEIMVDMETKSSGHLSEVIPELYPPRMIPDPEAKKPEDWVDEKMIPDPEDKKPEDWVDEEFIPDTEAVKPAEWDDDEDGEWEAPMVSNPDYKGPWEPRKIVNPAYHGEWVPPEIPNPAWSEDVEEKTARYRLGVIGLEIWQVKAGTIFDNFIVTDDVEEAKAFAEETWAALKDAEKVAFDTFHLAEVEKLKAEEEAEEARMKAAEEKEEETEEETWQAKREEAENELGVEDEDTLVDVDKKAFKGDMTHEQLVNLGLVDEEDTPKQETDKSEEEKEETPAHDEL